VNYPDRTEVFGMNLPLNYKFAPGETNDGITLAVPLAALGQLRPQRYEWLVPGMLEEKVTALIKSLPGGLRRNFVPVPEFAKAAITNMGTVEEISLIEALAKTLLRMTGVEVTPADFKPDTLPDYLKMAFRIVDDAGRTAAVSRDLPAIQRKLAKEASHAFSKLPGQILQREDVTDWDFDDLPEVVRVQRFNMSIDAYPALEVRPDGGVSLRLFPTALPHFKATA
jgi:ATP-dependent helicase HrpA